MKATLKEPQQQQQLINNNSAPIDTDSGLESLTYLSAPARNRKTHQQQSGGGKTIVAVKKLPENATAKNFFDLFKELKLMFAVGEHPNIVNLIGYCVDNSSLLIVTDFARFGNLKEFLRLHARTGGRHEEKHASKKKITREHLLTYSYQIALGMDYLHSKKVRFLFHLTISNFIFSSFYIV